MARFQDIPFMCLPFLALVQCTVLSKECCKLAKEALHLKDRGQGLVEHLKECHILFRFPKLNKGFNTLDIWSVWNHMAKVTKSSTLVFMRWNPFTIHVSTEVDFPAFGIHSSSQQMVSVQLPYYNCRKVTEMLQPTFALACTQISYMIHMLIGSDNPKVFTDVFWETSPLTFYAVDVSRCTVHMYEGVVISFQQPGAHKGAIASHTRCSRAHGIDAHMHLSFFVEHV
jgi:hypothetical protein